MYEILQWYLLMVRNLTITLLLLLRVDHDWNAATLRVDG